MYEYGYFQFCQHYMTQGRHEDRSSKCKRAIDLTGSLSERDIAVAIFKVNQRA